MKLLGLLPVHRPAQLAQQVFETAVDLFEARVAIFKPVVAIGERGELRAKGLQSDLLSLEQGPMGRFKRREIDLGNGNVHDKNTIIESVC